MLGLKARLALSARLLKEGDAELENIRTDGLIVRPERDHEAMLMPQVNAVFVIDVPGTFDAEDQQRDRLRHFGVPLEQHGLRLVDLPGFRGPIPAILVTLREYLVKHGLKVPGIFRESPSHEACLKTKHELDCGTFAACEDVHIIATCLKMWLRELPTRLLQYVDMNMLEAAGADREWHVALSVPEPEGSVLHWFIILCAETSAHADVNHMSAKNMAIVMCPNMVPKNDDSHQERDILMRIINWFEQVVTFALEKQANGVTVKELFEQGPPAQRRPARRRPSLEIPPHRQPRVKNALAAANSFLLHQVTDQLRTVGLLRKLEEEKDT
jgi:hypothetical protein